jgi:chorismate mutase
LTTSKNASQNKTSNAVVVQSNYENHPAEKRLLDLNDIKTRELLVLAPSRAEVDTLGINRAEALADYADRLRQDYKENKNGLREGFKILKDALDEGGQITVSCACRAGSEMCHADVVKMAIEKVNLHLKNQQIQEKDGISRADNKNISRADSQKPETNINPRTRRAINEILSLSENDKLLETISQTDGRNRSEQASFLGKSSQFIRDIYERGANVVGGKLIIPTENLNAPKTLAITTQEYAVKKLGEVLRDESKAKEIAPLVVEYGNKISGVTADGETKIKVFNWIYDSLEGRNDFLDRDGEARQIETTRFDNTLENISRLAGEMHELEPLDKVEFVPFAGLEPEAIERESGDRDENRLIEEIYEEAVSRDVADGIEKSDQSIEEPVQDFVKEGKTSLEAFERIDLNSSAPRLPQEFSEAEIAQLLTKTLPEIDRRLENGEKVAEILSDFHRIVRQSAQEDALNRLEKIYQRQNVATVKTDGIGGLSQSIQTQIGQIDLRRQNVIELKKPGEFFAAESEAHRTFYRKSKQEIGRRARKARCEVRGKNKLRAINQKKTLSKNS